MGSPRRVDPMRYLMSKVAVQDDGCWLWTGCKSSGGYGDAPIMLAPSRLAHRLSYSLLVGPIPDGAVVRHTCDVPPCVNPAHLRVGTQAENIADKVAKGRQAKGERNGNAKLSDAAWSDIVARVGRGEAQARLAREYGVTPQAVCQYLKRNALTVAS